MLDLHGPREAWAAWHACADALDETGAAAVTEELSSTVHQAGPQTAFAGFSRWGKGPLDSGLLAVVVEGSGWAMSDASRTVLHAGQAAFWRAGEFSSFGADRDMTLRQKMFCRMLVISAAELSLERVLSAAGDRASLSAVAADGLSPDVSSMQVFDCGSAAGAQACYDAYLDQTGSKGGMSRALALPGTVYGGHLWDHDHLVVFVNGGGWVADDRTRRRLRPGQGAFWPSGCWFACGLDPLAEIRMPGGTGLSVEAFLRHRPPPRQRT